MSNLTAAQVYQLALGAGLAPGNAVVATAVAQAESGDDPGSTGDVSLEDGTWGPSVGLWQIRTEKAETGTGATRDVNADYDPVTNAKAMAAVSGDGTNFGAWTTYTDGAYKQFLAAAEQASGVNPADVPAVPSGGSSSATATNASLLSNLNPLNLANKLVSNTFSGVASDLYPLFLTGAVVLGGIALVAMGAWRTVSDSSPKDKLQGLIPQAAPNPAGGGSAGPAPAAGGIPPEAALLA